MTKEKLIAAKRANIHTVLVPEKNRKNIEEIHNEVKSNLNIIYVSNMDEVLEIALITEEDRVDETAS